MPIVPGDGGVGYSWFAIELVDTDVPAPPPPKPPRFWEPGISESVLRRHIDRFPAEYLVTTSNVDSFTARYIVHRRERIAATFAIVQHNEDRTEVMLSVSTRMAQIRREDDEILTIL